MSLRAAVWTPKSSRQTTILCVDLTIQKQNDMILTSHQSLFFCSLFFVVNCEMFFANSGGLEEAPTYPSLALCPKGICVQSEWRIYIVQVASSHYTTGSSSM